MSALPKNRPHWSLPRAVGIVCVQFLGWWTAFFTILTLLALAEGIRLGQQGLRYVSHFSVEQIRVRELHVADDGRRAVALVGFRCQSMGAGIVPDVVLYDLQIPAMRRLDLSALEPRCVAISPRADAVAIAGADCSIYLATGRRNSGLEAGLSPSGEPRLLHRVGDEGIERLVFSPDGRQLAAVGVRFTHVLQFPEGRLAYQLAHQDGATTRAAFSDDARHLIVFHIVGHVKWYDARTGRLIDCRILTRQDALRTAVSSSGELVAGMSTEGRLSVWNLATDRELWHHQLEVSPNHTPNGLCFSPDGSLLAVACDWQDTYHLRYYDAFGGRLLGQSRRYEATFKGLTIAADQVLYAWDTEGVIHVTSGRTDSIAH
jgi:WD40 repeat protein